MTMKSAIELAMERFEDEPIRKLSDKQKKDIAEIDKKYQAKSAEAQVMNQDKLNKSYGDLQQIEQLKQDLVVEIASISEKCEREKDRVRNESE